MMNSADMVVLSSLEQMFEALQRRDENPKDVIPPLPSRPTSRGRLPSARKSRPVGFKVEKAISGTLSWSQEKEREETEAVLNSVIFGNKRVTTVEQEESPYVKLPELESYVYEVRLEEDDVSHSPAALSDSTVRSYENLRSWDNLDFVLRKEHGDSKLSNAKNLESLLYPETKLQRSLSKPERSPLREKKNLNVEEYRFLSDNANWSPKVPKSLKPGKTFARDLLKSESEEGETFVSDKENLTPQSSIAIKSKNAISQSHEKKEGETLRRRKERIPFLSLSASSPLRNSSPASHVEGLDETFRNNYVNNVHNLDEKAPDIEHEEELSHMPGRENNKWYFVVDVGCFLTKKSRKSLKLLEGIRGTQLIIPSIVIRELDHLKRCQGILSRGKKASSVLQWIEECMMKTSWWIHVQSSSETFPVAPTPPATPRSQLCDGSSVFGSTTSANFNGFSACRSLLEIVSPTAEDHILDCALLFKRMKDDGQLVLLTSSTTLKIKAIAEGLCVRRPGNLESLLNAFSKRFIWEDSSPKRSTLSCFEKVGLPKNCHKRFGLQECP